MKTFTSICLDSPTPSVAYSDDYGLADGWTVEQADPYSGKNVLVNGNGMILDGSEVDGFWTPKAPVAPAEYAHLILDLHCVATVNGVEMVNTACCSIISFSIWVAMSQDGPWTEGTEVADLVDNAGKELPLPVETFMFENPIQARFVRFRIIEGVWGGGLQYLKPLTGGLYSKSFVVC